MKKYVFRLETVRRVRRTQQELAKADLLAANSEVAKAITAVEERTNEYEGAVASITGPTTVDMFMKRRYFNELSGKAVIAATASRRAAEVEAAAKRDLYTEAARKVKALDRLDARRHSEHSAEAQRQETVEVDDMVTGRHMRRSG